MNDNRAWLSLVTEIASTDAPGIGTDPLANLIILAARTWMTREIERLLAAGGKQPIPLRQIIIERGLAETALAYARSLEPIQRQA